jgi:dTDP-glucose 4,6-dehydratase
MPSATLDYPMLYYTPSDEHDLIVQHSLAVWERLRGARIFITGGTGFYGSWLLESLIQAEVRLGLGVEVVVLSRNPERILDGNPFRKNRSFLSFIKGDIRTFPFPEGKFSHVIHAATEASEKLNKENPLLMIDTIVEGTRHTLDFAVHSGVKHFLHTSSGAVYGNLPASLGPVPEDYTGGPDILQPKWAYGEGKRLAELLCCIYGERHGISVKNARCFATVGPRLPLKTHFAIGNFISDALRGKDIIIEGDGTPIRSYIDVADLTVWLWHILIFGKAGNAYNVGSEEGHSIAEVAKIVRDVLNSALEIKVLGRPIPQQLASVYVPSTKKAQMELGLKAEIPLKTSIQRTAEWEKRVSGNNSSE